MKKIFLILKWQLKRKRMRTRSRRATIILIQTLLIIYLQFPRIHSPIVSKALGKDLMDQKIKILL